MFSKFGVFRCPSISHSSVVFKRFAKNIFLRFFGTPKGCQKTGKKNVFLWLSRVCVFFPFVSSWSPVVFTYLVVCKCVIHPRFLLLLLSFFSVVVFPCFCSSLSLLFSVQLFVFAVFSLGVRKTQIKWENLSQFCFHACASVPASPHCHLAQLIILLGPEKNPSKWFIFALCLALLTMCWSTYFYSVFCTSTNFCPQNGSP